jgi:hypothetical protein
MTVSVQWLYSYLWSTKNWGHIWRYNDTSVNFISQTRCQMSCWDGKYWDLPVQLIPYPPSLSMATLENLRKLFKKHGSPLHLCSKQFHKPKKPSVTSWIHLWIISNMLRPVRQLFHPNVSTGILLCWKPEATFLTTNIDHKFPIPSLSSQKWSGLQQKKTWNREKRKALSSQQTCVLCVDLKCIYIYN